MDPLRLHDCVAAVLPPHQTGRALGLVPSDTESTLLTGPSDLDRLSRDGLLGVFDRVAAALGDEGLVVEEIQRALGEGQHLIIVPVETIEDGKELVSELREITSGPVWHFAEWTFTRTGGAAPA